MIIAAGQGTRIRSAHGDIPKTLLKVNGKRIIDYLLENCTRSGIEDIVIVTGHKADLIQGYMNGKENNLNIEFMYNPDWEFPNGLSVLAARSHIPNGEDFLISMSDHLYSSDILQKLIDNSLADATAIVGLEFKLDKIFDIDDSMKVTVDPNNNSKIIGMGKRLITYDAIDCGVFKCRYEFFKTLEMAKEEGNYSLSDACNILIHDGKMGGIDIEDDFWIDVDTAEALRYVQDKQSLSWD